MSFFVLLNFRAFYIIVFESAVVIRVFFRCTTLMIWRSFSRLIVRLSFILSNCLFLTYLHEECNTSDGLRTDLCLFTVKSPYGFSCGILLLRPVIYGCGWWHRSGCTVMNNASSISGAWFVFLCLDILWLSDRALQMYRYQLCETDHKYGSLLLCSFVLLFAAAVGDCSWTGFAWLLPYLFLCLTKVPLPLPCWNLFDHRALEMIIITTMTIRMIASIFLSFWFFRNFEWLASCFWERWESYCFEKASFLSIAFRWSILGSIILFFLALVWLYRSKDIRERSVPSSAEIRLNGFVFSYNQGNIQICGGIKCHVS